MRINPKYVGARYETLRTIAGAAGCALALSSQKATAATVSLPLNINAGGATWYVSDQTSAYTGALGLGITEAALTGPPARSDAYDGAFVMQVNGTTFASPGGAADLTGTTLTSGTQSMSGLNVTAQYYFATASPTVRALYSYANPTASPITVAVAITHNLGSDSNTAIVATSSGDTTYDAADSWVISWDGNPSGDPVLTYVRFGSGASVVPTVAAAPGTGVPRDRIGDTYSITVPAHATRRIMIFGRLSQDSSTAQAATGSYNSLNALSSAGLLDGLTAQQLAEVVNWSGSATNPPAGAPDLGPTGLGVLAILLVTLAAKSVRKMVSTR